jgi:sensor domain CHASE-containing protein/HAMP domain-containing protein
MSLRAKVLLIVLGVVSLYALLDYASQYFLVLPSYISLERNEAQNIMRRCVAALKKEISNLDKAAVDLAKSDDTYQFVVYQNNDYISTNPAVESLTNNSLDLIYICDIGSAVVWGQIRDLQTDEIIGLDEFPGESRPGTHQLLGHKTVEDSTTGVLMTEGGAMLVASRPIVTSNNEGPIRGTLIMGRFVNDNVLKTITEQVPVDLKVWTIGNRSIPAEERGVLNHIKAESQFHIRELSDDSLRVHTVVSDIQGVPVLLMRADIARDIRAKAITGSIRSGLLSNLATGLFVLLVLFVLLQSTVIGPIGKLTAHAIAIGNSANVSAPFTLRRSDEIGTLAREFDNMVEQLAESRKKLSEQSYHFGKAEVASGVLHNTRNVLTPLVSRVDNLRQKLQGFPIKKIEMAQVELLEINLSKQRRQDLTRLINLANESLVCLVRETKDKLDKVAKQLAQIEGIVAQQSKFTKTDSPAEEVNLDRLVRDSIELLPNDFCNTISFEIDPSLETVEPVRAHSITLLQVFNNILLNGAQSIQRSGTIQGKISIRAETEDAGRVGMVHLQIRDNGEGIESGKLRGIFERGSSAKRSLPLGIGLHWCANAIAEMNGRIYPESEGKGRGSCFHILLPSFSKTVNVLDVKAQVEA